VPAPLQWESSWEIATGVLVTSSIFATAVFMPIIGFFSTIFIPLPILFYRIKLGRQAGLTIGLISLTVMIMVLKSLDGLSINILFFIELLLLGYVLSELFEKKMSIEKTVGYACAAVFGSALILIFSYSLFTQTGLLRLVSDYVAQNLELTLRIYEGMGISQSTLSDIKASLDRIQYILVRIIPSLATSGLLLVAWSNLLIAKPLFKRQLLKYPDFGNLSCWKTPEMLIWGLIGSGLLIIIPFSGLRMIGVNGLITMFTIYFFQGIAIVAFILKKKKIPRMLQTFIYTMIALQQILVLVVVGIGIFDMWIDIRKLNRSEVS
jgi:uncharacterized protein YybS (DUF2232 family)